MLEQQNGNTRPHFYDPNYTSCTSFIAHIAQTRFGFDPAPVAELIRWADIVDGALYESPKAAVEMAEPAMKLTLVIESSQDPAFIPKLIPLLTTMSLSEVLEQPFVADLLPPLLERHRKSLEIIGKRTELVDGTLYFDITDQPFEGYNKFVPYFLYPDATYSVGLSKSSFRTKVAVGSNPWTKARPDQMVNLAQICERYGGGGHARVGRHLLSARPGRPCPRRRRRNCQRASRPQPLPGSLRALGRLSGSLTTTGCSISRSFFARCGIPPMMTAECVG